MGEFIYGLPKLGMMSPVARTGPTPLSLVSSPSRRPAALGAIHTGTCWDASRPCALQPEGERTDDAGASAKHPLIWPNPALPVSPPDSGIPAADGRAANKRRPGQARRTPSKNDLVRCGRPHYSRRKQQASQRQTQGKAEGGARPPHNPLSHWPPTSALASHVTYFVLLVLGQDCLVLLSTYLPLTHPHHNTYAAHQAAPIPLPQPEAQRDTVPDPEPPI